MEEAKNEAKEENEATLPKRSCSIKGITIEISGCQPQAEQIQSNFED